MISLTADTSTVGLVLCSLELVAHTLVIVSMPHWGERITVHMIEQAASSSSDKIDVSERGRMGAYKKMGVGIIKNLGNNQLITRACLRGYTVQG